MPAFPLLVGHPSRTTAARRWGLIACIGVLAWSSARPAAAVTVQGLYEANVPMAERSESAQASAFQDAMRQVLVRVTGRRDAGEDPALAPLVNDARRYVQQFRVVGGNQFVAGFDGERVERAVVDAGQPLWGHERPATLVVLAVGEASGRSVLTTSSTGELKQAVQRGAQLRGLPILWPEAARPIIAAQFAGESAQSLREIGARYGADAVLAGVSAAPGAGSAIRWTLVQGEETNQWRGTAEEGPHGAADWFARAFAAGSDSSGDGAAVAITVSGVSDLRAYASVTEYLQSLTLVQALAVDEVAGDNVVYRARVRGGAERLARAISLGGRLEPQSPEASNGDVGGALAYRYRP